MHREQKRAIAGIIIFGGVLAAVTVMFIQYDPTTIMQNRPLELTYVILLASSFILYGLFYLLSGRKTEGEEIPFDERDNLIAKFALNVQLFSVIGVLSLWCIVLTRIYLESGFVPVPLMYIMLNSIYFINMLARSIAIVHGYKMPIQDLGKC